MSLCMPESRDDLEVSQKATDAIGRSYAEVDLFGSPELAVISLSNLSLYVWATPAGGGPNRCQRGLQPGIVDWTGRERVAVEAIWYGCPLHLEPPCCDLHRISGRLGRDAHALGVAA